VTTLLTDDQHVDVAADIVVATRIRTEHERVANARIWLKDCAELFDQTDGSCVKFSERRIHRIRGVHMPHSQRTNAPTLDDSLPEELLEGQLYGTRASMDPPNEVARMELLPGRTRQQRQQASFGPRTFDRGHGLDDTPVSQSDTVVSVARRGFEPLTSSLKGTRSREAAQRFLHARTDTGSARKRVSEKRPNQRQ
jgi:hypothetical protein